MKSPNIFYVTLHMTFVFLTGSHSGSDEDFSPNQEGHPDYFSYSLSLLLDSD